MKHRRAVAHNRNFSRTGEGYRNVRASVARALSTADFDGEPTDPPSEADLYEAERAFEDALELRTLPGFDWQRDCCPECTGLVEPGAERVLEEARSLLDEYYGRLVG